MSNSPSHNPKSAGNSMDEVMKAFGELELIIKQQGHEDPQKDPKSASESSSASSMAELVKAFAELELCYEQVNEDPEEVICSGKKVLDMLLREEMDDEDNASAPLAHGRSLTIACVLNMLGDACMCLNKYYESLKYFNWSNRKLNELLEDGVGGSCSFVLDSLIQQTHAGLFDTKRAMGRKEDAPPHMKKVLEIKEKTMEEGCLGLGEAYKDLYKAYFEIYDCKEALPYCLKALDIYTRRMGEDSEEVALIRKDLGIVYADMKDYDSALEHNVLANSVLESDGGQGPIMSEVLKGYILSQSGRHEQAVRALKVVISHGVDTLDTCGKVLAFTTMAIALCGQEKFGEARKYIDAACEILDKETMPSLLVARELWDLAVLYQMVKDDKTAMRLLRKVLKTSELPKEDLLRFYKGFYALVYRTDKEEEELPYMEDVVERLKESFGPKHIEVGYANCDLGVACMVIHKGHEVVKYLQNSKEILDASLGPRHIKSLKISQTLSRAYAIAGRFDLAIPCQEKVVEGMKAVGPSEHENLIEAVGLLRAMQSGMVNRAR